MKFATKVGLVRACACAAVGAFATAAVPPAHAAEADEGGLALEEIVGTAQKPPEKAQLVPISMSVISGADLQNSGSVRLEDFSGLIPNVNVDTGNSLRS